MTFHSTSSREAQGHQPNKALGHKTSPRLAVSFNRRIMDALSASAAEHDIPAAQLVREAVEQYLIAQGTLRAEGR